jgi:hypothetical protein
MRHCSQARLDPGVAAAMVLTTNVPAEGQDCARLQHIFGRYTESYSSSHEFVRSLGRKGQLERKQFLLLCRDAKLINRTRFTVNDCNQVSE